VVRHHRHRRPAPPAGPRQILADRAAAATALDGAALDGAGLDGAGLDGAATAADRAEPA
jgi:hypothetical protein